MTTEVDVATLVARPPRTIRPNHRVIQALEADDVAGAWLDLLVETLQPGPWSVPTENGFWWIPFRLRHDLSVAVDEHTGALICRSETTIATDVDVRTALEVANYWNLRPFGCTFLVDVASASMSASATVMLDAASWFNAFVFVQGVARAVGILENLAPRLVESVAGTLPVVAHPHLGERTDPDQFLSEHMHATYQPEASSGLWFSDPEIIRFRSSIQHLVGEAGFASDADHLTGTIDRRITSAENLRCDLSIPVEFSALAETKRSGLVDVRLAVSNHPDLGAGLERLIRTPVHVDSERLPDAATIDSYDGLFTANSLNAVELKSPSSPLGTGPWSIWRGQLCNALFIDGETARTLQSLAGPTTGDVLAALMDWTALGPISTMVACLDQTEPGTFELGPTDVWDGIEENAGRAGLLIDNSVAVPATVGDLPLNQRIEPLDVTQELWGVPRGRVAATFGIFNPVGPSVGSVEVAIDYASQLALVFERLAHPFFPRLTLHAVLDRAGFERRAAIVRDVIADLEWGLLDWCHVIDPDQDVADAVYDGLAVFAERSDADIATKAAEQYEHVSSPWDRLNATEPSPPLEDAESDVAVWVSVITHPMNIDAHVAYLRSAWEGAKLFVQEDGVARAQSFANQLQLEIAQRRSTEYDDRIVTTRVFTVDEADHDEIRSKGHAVEVLSETIRDLDEVGIGADCSMCGAGVGWIMYDFDDWPAFEGGQPEPEERWSLTCIAVQEDGPARVLCEDCAGLLG